MDYNLHGNTMKNILLNLLVISSISVFAQEKAIIEFENKNLIKINGFEQLSNNYNPEFQFENQQREKKSIGKAFFYSLLLPGLGEAYVGNTTYTKVFLSLEVIGWGFLLGNYQHVAWLKKDYENFAYQHANVSKKSKDDQYWIDIGKFNTIYEYNEQRRRDRDVTNIYDENDQYFWQWDTKSNRFDYDGRRIHSKDLENDEVYYMGAIVLNHIVSAINALRLAKAYNSDIKESGWIMGVEFNNYRNSLSLSVSQNF